MSSNHWQVPKGFVKSTDAGNFVCNYALWVAQNYVNKKKLNTKIHMIHVPANLKKKDTAAVEEYLKQITMDLS